MHRAMEGGRTGANGRGARKPAGQESPVRSDSAGMSLLRLANYVGLVHLVAGLSLNRLFPSIMFAVLIRVSDLEGATGPATCR